MTTYGSVLTVLMRPARATVMGMTSFGLLFSLFASPAAAGPEGGIVSHGSASITAGANRTDIHQASQNAVIDWTSFNVAPHETVQFHHISNSALTVNRIHDNAASLIDGAVLANGRIALINKNGVVFGNNAMVDVGGLVVSTADIADISDVGDILRLSVAGADDARIEHNGHITVREAGLAAFVAPHVVNNGVIVAQGGSVVLGAGRTATVDLYGDGLVNLAMDDDVALRVTNTGRINADLIALKATDARHIVDSIINNSGVLEAGSAALKNGKIILGAAGSNDSDKTGSSTLLVGGALTALGGAIELAADNIGLLSDARLDVSHDTVAGSVHVGGDYMGTGQRQRARAVDMMAGAHIDASSDGDAGRVILWSDNITRFNGDIDASGAGGFVETSSKNILAGSGNVLADEWLLDPNNITIQTALPDGRVTGNPDFTTLLDNAVVNANSIIAALNNGTNVTITTGSAGANTELGNIVIDANINKTSGGAATLRLNAANSIIMGGRTVSSTSDALSVVFNVDTDANQAGAIFLNGATITTNGGNVFMGSGYDGTNGFAFGTATHVNGISLLNSTINAGAGAVTLRGRGFSGNAALSNMDGITLNNSTISGSGNITLIGQGGSGVNNNDGISLMNNATITSSGTGNIITLDGTGVGTGQSNMGVTFVTGGRIYSTATAANGARINVTGTGGNGTLYNHGVLFDGSTSRLSTQTGHVIVTGNSGAGTDNNFGVFILNSGGITSSGTIAANAANITVNGTGNGTGNNNIGVNIQNSATAINSSRGSIAVTGISNGAGTGNHGIRMANSSQVRSLATTGTGKTISMSGRSSGTNSHGLVTFGGTNVIGNSNFYGDINLNLSSVQFSNLPQIAARNTIRLAHYDPNGSIGIGTGVGSLRLTSAQMAAFQNRATLVIGTPGSLGSTQIIGWNVGTQTFAVEAYGGTLGLSGLTLRSSLLASATGVLRVTGDITAQQNITLESGFDVYITGTGSSAALRTDINTSNNRIITVIADKANNRGRGVLSMNSFVRFDAGNGGRLRIFTGLRDNTFLAGTYRSTNITAMTRTYNVTDFAPTTMGVYFEDDAP